MNDVISSPHGIRVQVRGLRKNFNGTCVLDGIDLDIARGETFVIMGPSGSGKSVLLKHLIGLEIPSAGEILLEGEPLGQPGVMDKFRLAMVFQSSALLNSLTVGENVGLYLEEHQLKTPEEIKRVVEEKLELVGLKGQTDRYPGELSGGMRKRVAIARALVIEPQLILYDEPTSELDPVVAVTVAEEIVKLKRRLQVTSILVTHDRELAFGVADRIALIQAGRILMIGTPAEVKQAGHPLIRNFLSIDFSHLNLN